MTRILQRILSLVILRRYTEPLMTHSHFRGVRFSACHLHQCLFPVIVYCTPPSTFAQSVHRVDRAPANMVADTETMPDPLEQVRHINPVCSSCVQTWTQFKPDPIQANANTRLVSRLKSHIPNEDRSTLGRVIVHLCGP